MYKYEVTLTSGQQLKISSNTPAHTGEGFLTIGDNWFSAPYVVCVISLPVDEEAPAEYDIGDV